MSNSIKTYKLVEILPEGNVSTKDVCPITPHQEFIIGGKYKALTSVLEKIFECIAYIDYPEENPDSCLDVVIMKQVGGHVGRIWPLSESDCEFLHVKYENGLVVFPATYNFKRIS